MRLPVPGPRDVLSAFERGTDQIEALVGAVPRVLALLDDAERLLVRASAAIDRVREVTESAHVVVVRTSGVVDDADAQVARITGLLDTFEPSLTRLQPTIQTLADTTSPEEVAALVGLVDHLPALTEQVERDLLPVLSTLGTVAPDLRDLLNVSRELNEILGKVPGIGRLKRKVEEEDEEIAAAAP